MGYRGIIIAATICDLLPLGFPPSTGSVIPAKPAIQSMNSTNRIKERIKAPKKPRLL